MEEKTRGWKERKGGEEERFARGAGVKGVYPVLTESVVYRVADLPEFRWDFSRQRVRMDVE